MSDGLASLHKILKDETRRKIVLLLNEKGSLSYTELMETLGFVTTGLLNYHLKVLGDLLAKNENGWYILTEKGKLALKLLLEFPEAKVNGSSGKPTWWRKFWIAVAAITTVAVILRLTMYFLGYIDLTGLYQSALWIVASICIAYTIQRITREVLSKKTQLLLNKIAYTMLGVWLGWVASFFGVILLVLLSRYLGGPELGRIEGGGELWIAAIVMLSVVGGVWGYRFGRKRGFRRPEPKWIF
jgi:DNA-binding transcriptional ArsR family regulator